MDGSELERKEEDKHCVVWVKIPKDLKGSHSEGRVNSFYTFNSVI